MQKTEIPETITKQRPKMKKPKKDKQKQDKRNAFMSFLQAPTTSQSVILQSEKKNASDNQNQTYQQFVQDGNECKICQQKLDPVKKKKCGFCQLQICDKHLRKRRRKNKKYQRICDYCQDKTLFENYMKLQLKAEQALTTQQEIVGFKYAEFFKQVQIQRQKRKQLIFKAESIKSKFDDQSQKLNKQEKIIQQKQKQHQKQKIQLKQLELFVERLNNTMKQNYQQDYKILLIENDKLGKDLMNLDKRKSEIQKAIEKRQKQIQKAYEQWEKKQYMKNLDQQNRAALANKKKDCVIY